MHSKTAIMAKGPKSKTIGRANPIAKPVKPPADPELAAIREKQILPVINELKSSDTNKRSSAAVVIANLIEDTKCRKLLLREQVVRILLEQTITDSSLESKSAGWGILRNLALEEEPDFCIHLYRQDILTPIQAVIQNVRALDIYPWDFIDNSRSSKPSNHKNILLQNFQRDSNPFYGL
jgi:hypothetical protein